ncbi:hypothetical protein MPTK1_3g08760 [Marchantia polymorpha subsp. ruderalis]|uniref:Uncharacterized protein n=2 Tax=Marchantia polymorpha TaxID=3197 RepID=A0AAF6AYT1_MARPO|nr:hypothetical protein MARPO_0105s0041 [Marchantia polymorpha]BBN04915.1 hypothetical protein Mp_3g08760 [Marchantia polymorpha subsp. ruderalis]|eukprot:PTQ31929.1 hypothetical protein MARPO_0105s0041 [Marchantia polymorpha]
MHVMGRSQKLLSEHTSVAFELHRSAWSLSSKISGAESEDKKVLIEGGNGIGYQDIPHPSYFKFQEDRFPSLLNLNSTLRPNLFWFECPQSVFTADVMYSREPMNANLEGFCSRTHELIHLLNFPGKWTIFERG